MSSELKVGLFFTIGVVGILVFIFCFSNLLQPKGEYVVRFPRVVRLKAGDQATYNGVRIGLITAVRPKLIPDANGIIQPLVEVVFTVDSAARANVLVDENSVYTISQGLLGSSSIDIRSNGGKEITKEILLGHLGVPPTNLDEAVASIKDLVDKNKEEIHNAIASIHAGADHFSDLAVEAKNLIAENKKKLSEAIANISDMAANIRDVVKKNNEAITDAIAHIRDVSGHFDEVVQENRATVQEMFKRFTVAGDNVGKAAATINDTVTENRPALKTTLDNVAKFAPRLDKIGENLELVTDQVASGKGTLGKLVFEDTLHDKAVTTLDNFNQRLEEIKPVTSGFSELKFYGGIDAGMNSSSGVTDTYVYLRIEPRPWKFYQGGISYRTAPRHRATFQDNPNTLNIDFNLLLGWRFFHDDNAQMYRLTVAGGLIDSEPGGYVQIPLIGDRLGLTIMGRAKDNQRLFNDRRYEEGHAEVRATLDWRVWKRVSIEVGGDDLYDKPGLWGAVRAELLDNDLRNIVTVAGLGH